MVTASILTTLPISSYNIVDQKKPTLMGWLKQYLKISYWRDDLSKLYYSFWKICVTISSEIWILNAYLPGTSLEVSYS